MKITFLMRPVCAILLCFLIAVSGNAQNPEENVIIIKSDRFDAEIRYYNVTTAINKEMCLKLEKELIEIRGIDVVLVGRSLGRYTIKVKKGLPFSWSKIEPAIINCLTRSLYNGVPPKIFWQ